MTIVWSNGGGTQSAAIAVLIIQGKIPKPDVAVIADTGRESSETWYYLRNVTEPALNKAGVEMVQVDKFKSVDLWGGKKGDTVLMPMFTSSGGQVPKYCSTEWKTRQVDRYCTSIDVKNGTMWLGFSSDELNRVKTQKKKSRWFYDYPLINQRITRNDCYSIVSDFGWPTPPRSSCYCCPYRSDKEWLHQRDNEPNDHAQAIKLEREIQKKDPDLFFHRSGQPLDTVDFNESQQDLLPCDSGHCFT